MGRVEQLLDSSLGWIDLDSDSSWIELDSSLDWVEQTIVLGSDWFEQFAASFPDKFFPGLPNTRAPWISHSPHTHSLVGGEECGQEQEGERVEEVEEKVERAGVSGQGRECKEEMEHDVNVKLRYRLIGQDCRYIKTPFVIVKQGKIWK